MRDTVVRLVSWFLIRLDLPFVLVEQPLGKHIGLCILLIQAVYPE